MPAITTIAGFFKPQRRRSEPARQPGRFQTARIDARSRRRSQADNDLIGILGLSGFESLMAAIGVSTEDWESI